MVLFDKIKTRMQISEYLNEFKNYKDYCDTKSILEDYYFNPKKYQKRYWDMRDGGGPYEMLEYTVDQFEKFVQEKENKRKANSIPSEEKWITADSPEEENDYKDVQWSDLAIPKEDLDLN